MPAVLAAMMYGKENILEHLQSDRRSGASNKLSLNQFYLNNVTNLRQLTTQSTIDIMSYSSNMEIVSWP